MLELTTKRTHQSVKIDGVQYDLADRAELPLQDAFWLEKAQKRLKTLSAVDDLNEAAGRELAQLILKCGSLIMGEIPAEVQAKLTDLQKVAIIAVYVEELKPKSPLAPGEKEGQTGATSSPSSEGSTGEAEQTGSQLP